MPGKVRKHTAKDGTVSYWIRVELPPDPLTGQRKRERQSFARKRDAEAALAAAEVRVRQGTYVPRSDLTLGELLWQWYATTTGLKPLSRQSYERTIRVHLIPGLGSVPVQKLQVATLEAFYLQKQAAGVGRRSLQLCHQRLHQALELAVRWGLVQGNPAKSARLPSWEEADAATERQTWSLEECHRLLAVAHQSIYGPLWPTMLGTGLRIGEALGLRWSDLDLDTRDQHGQPAPELRVVQTVEPIGGKPTPQPAPKSPGARRTLTLEPEIARALHEHRAWQNERRLQAGPGWHDLDLVFAARNGNPLRHAGYERDLDRLCAAAGVPRITVHEIRHTYACRALEAGVPLEVISKLLGHADVSITARIYARVSADLARRGARAAGAALFRPPPTPGAREPQEAETGGSSKASGPLAAH
jgi:integrase